MSTPGPYSSPATNEDDAHPEDNDDDEVTSFSSDSDDEFLTTARGNGPPVDREAMVRKKLLESFYGTSTTGEGGTGSDSEDSSNSGMSGDWQSTDEDDDDDGDDAHFKNTTAPQRRRRRTIPRPTRRHEGKEVGSICSFMFAHSLVLYNADYFHVLIEVVNYIYIYIYIYIILYIPGEFCRKDFSRKGKLV